MKLKPYLLFCYLTLLLSSVSSYADTDGPTFTSGITQLNSATTSGDQINPSIASLPGNQFVMTWSDRASNDGDRGGIFGRIYDETLTPITSEFLVNTLTSDWQSKSNVASASNGNFMAIWHQSNGYVEGQIFNASGDKLGSQFTVQEGFNGLSDVVADSAGNFWVVSTVNNGSGYINKYSNTGELLVDSKVYQSDVVAFDPVITALSDGRILIGWYDGQNTSGSDIYGQFVTAAGELDGDPFMVNTTLAENQSSQAIAGLSSGGFVVTWQSLLQDGDLAGIYARVFDKAGVGGSEIAVNTLTSGNQVKSYVTARSDGGFVVGWVDAKAPQQVYVQSYAADGTAQGANQAVSIDDVLTVNDSTNIEFTELTDGSLVAAWDAWKGSRNIYGRAFNVQSDVVDPPVVEPPSKRIGFTSGITQLNSATTSGDQINPSIASLPGNQFVMTWSDRASNDGDRGGIFGRIYDETLTPITSEFLVNTLTSDWQSKSNVASASNGNFMAIWHQSNGYVEGQIFNASGDKLGSQFTVQEGFNGLSDVVADSAGNFWVVSTVNNGSGYINKYSNTGELLVDSKVYQSDVVAFDPVITALSDGRILIGWYDGQNTSGSDIYGQFVTAAGELDGDPFMVNTTLAENQSSQAIAGLSSGGFVVTWQSLLQDGDLAGIYARVFDKAGVGGSEIAVNTLTSGNQVKSYVTARSDGGFVVGWVDAKAPQQVYVQSYAADGTAQGANQAVSIDDVLTVNDSTNIEFTELTDGSLVAAWDAWKGSRNIYGRTFELNAIVGTEDDSDGDGVLDINDDFPNDPSETTDTDGDGIGNNVDPDDDGDDVLDINDAFELISLDGRIDTDGDGYPNDCDAVCEQIGMVADTDDDADGVLDADDAFPLDSTESIDADGDGIGANTDFDDNDPAVGISAQLGPTFTSGITQLNSATTSGDQINPSIASLPGNQFVMTWSDRASNDGDRGGIFGRIYDETLTPITSEFLVNTLTSDWQSKSNVASASNGNFMAIWHQSNGYVEGQIFNASGDKLGSQFTVQEGFNGLSDVVADSAGNFWVVSTVNNGSGYINKYSNTGELLVDSKVYQSDVVAFDPVITALSDGRILIGWYDGQNTSGSDIYGQFVTAAGELDGDPFMVNTTLAENQSSQAIAGLSSGGFVVTWQSLLQDGDLAGIYARVFDKAGVGGSEIAVNTLTSGNQVKSYVTARSDGGFVVGWVDAKAPQQVYVQSYAADGTAQGANQAVSIDDVLTVNDSTNIEFTELTDGSLVAAWDAWKGSRNIYGRTFELNAIVGTEDDSDGDGVLDINDDFPNDPSETTDTDGDGIGNNVDPDDDGDSELDSDDAFPLDATESIDTDLDGIGNNADLDDDNDLVIDANDIFPLDASESLDTDGDGIGNNADTDDDGDSVLDSDDAFPLDATESIDTDLDGIGNNTDTDDDGDTVSDVDEATSGTNPLLADTDRDGFSDAQELIDATDPLDKDDCATCTPPVSGIAYHWNNHALLESVDVSLVGLTDGVENDFAEQGLSSASGQYAFTEKHRGTNHLTASKVITDGESGSVISSADALAALKIAVGINPNTDPDGSGPLEALPVSPYQYIAADINGDGRITSADALAILKMAVKLDSAEPRRWVFVSEDYEFWDEASKSFLTTRADITWNSSGMIFEYPEKSIQNVVGVLMGDVNGNWSAPEGSEALGESYLSELIKSQGGSLGQWGLVDKSVEDDASEDVTKASDLEKVTDGKEYSQDLSSVEIVVNGTVRDYYVYVPSSSNTSPIPLLYLLNGGSAERTPFEQQSNFEAMADREGIVLVVPVSQKLPSNESAWQLNADNSSMQDIDYIEAIYTDVSSRTAIDANRVYAIGYSLGGMFSYELACQMSNRFAAIGSLAGSMPVAPTYCDPYRNVPILHVHGVQDEIIPYSSQWEWKAWDAVGTMRDTPSLIEFWSSRYNCSKQSKRSITATVDLDVREDCESGARVEHYRLENGTHVWPTLIGDLETPEVFWSFLSSFSLESTSP